MSSLFTFASDNAHDMYAKLANEVVRQLVYWTSPLPTPSTPFFYLDDPRGSVQVIYFTDISTWEHLHDYLLHRFPPDDPGHVVILQKSYLFRQDGSTADMMWTGPCSPPLDEAVQSHDRILMSAIFPHEPGLEEQCPKCQHYRPAEFSGDALSCYNCPLELTFRDSYDNQPDPLTQTVLDDIRLAHQTRHFADTTISQHGIHDWIETEMARMRHPLLADRRPTTIQNCLFYRVTVCQPQWPDLSHRRPSQDAAKRLAATMAGLSRHIDYLAADDFPVARVASLLHSRVWLARDKAHLVQFLQTVVQAHRQRQRVDAWASQNTQDARRITQDLARFAACARAHLALFGVAALRLRGLLWIVWDAVQLEASVTKGLAKLLRPWSLAEGVRREPTPLLAKALFLPHAVLLTPVWRLTIDVIGDIVEWATATSKGQPSYLLPALCQLLSLSGPVAWHFVLDGHLDRFFETHANKDRLGRLWMQNVLQTGGAGLDSVELLVQLKKLIDDGQVYV